MVAVAAQPSIEAQHRTRTATVFLHGGHWHALSQSQPGVVYHVFPDRFPRRAGPPSCTCPAGTVGIRCYHWGTVRAQLAPPPNPEPPCPPAPAPVPAPKAPPSLPATAACDFCGREGTDEDLIIGRMHLADDITRVIAECRATAACDARVAARAKPRTPAPLTDAQLDTRYTLTERGLAHLAARS